MVHTDICIHPVDTPFDFFCLVPLLLLTPQCSPPICLYSPRLQDSLTCIPPAASAFPKRFAPFRHDSRSQSLTLLGLASLLCGRFLFFILFFFISFYLFYLFRIFPLYNTIIFFHFVTASSATPRHKADLYTRHLDFPTRWSPNVTMHTRPPFFFSPQLFLFPPPELNPHPLAARFLFLFSLPTTSLPHPADIFDRPMAS